MMCSPTEKKTNAKRFVYTGTLNSNDVLCGRGKRLNRYEGNVKFRTIVQGKEKEYIGRAKSEVARRVAQEVADLGGRFLRMVVDEGGNEVWEIVDDLGVMQKIQQAFRDLTAACRKKSFAKEAKKQHLPSADISSRGHATVGNDEAGAVAVCCPPTGIRGALPISISSYAVASQLYPSMDQQSGFLQRAQVQHQRSASSNYQQQNLIVQQQLPSWQQQQHHHHRFPGQQHCSGDKGETKALLDQQRALFTALVDTQEAQMNLEDSVPTPLALQHMTFLQSDHKQYAQEHHQQQMPNIHQQQQPMLQQQMLMSQQHGEGEKSNLLTCLLDDPQHVLPNDLLQQHPQSFLEVIKPTQLIGQLQQQNQHRQQRVVSQSGFFSSLNPQSTTGALLRTDLYQQQEGASEAEWDDTPIPLSCLQREPILQSQRQLVPRLQAQGKANASLPDSWLPGNLQKNQS